MLVALPSPGGARGQGGLVGTVNPTAPQAVISSGGHSGEIRALAFVQPEGEGLFVLSAGMDKVVNVWAIDGGPLDGPPRLARALRPPIFRGPAGAIFAMDLSPVDDDGQRLLAVGGYGVQASRGDITVFRFPGRPDRPTGEVAAVLREGYTSAEYDPGGPSGHFNTVMALRFHPKTRNCLASGSYDGTVRLWNLANLERPHTFRLLRGHQALIDPAPLRGKFNERVEELAFTPDGSRLIVCVTATGLDDSTAGFVRVWDVSDLNNPRLVEPQLRNHEREGRPGAWVNPRCLAISPDGRWVFLGQENGLLLRYELTAAGLVNQVTLATDPRQGPVEALACQEGPDGPRLLSSIIGRHDDPSQPPPLACDIDLWPVPAPGKPGPARVAPLRRIGRADGRVRAVALSGDGRRAAFGGGDAQGLYLRDLSRPDPPDLAPDIALEGVGRTIWDVRFSRDGTAVGFSRVRPGGDAPPPKVFDGFKLAGDFDADRDRMIALDPAALQGVPTTSHDGRWTIRPDDREPSQVLQVVGRADDRERCAIRLDPVREVRWWCFGFIPPGPGHPEEVVAVGTETGVTIFRPVDGGGECPRVRVLAGHSGAVFSLAPSPDGRWLATGSADQTIRLWPLDGCDRVAPLGATLDLQPGPFKGKPWWIVSDVQPDSFADQMGMQDGDAVLEIHSAAQPPIDQRMLDALGPDSTIQFVAYRADPETRRYDKKIGEGFVSGYMTRKRDRPALTLFPGVDREWIAWTPKGFYQSSIRGDTEYLAWHRNRSALGGATDAESFDAFADDLRRPDVLTALFRPPGPVEAPRRVGQAAAVAEVVPPPLPQVDATLGVANAPGADSVVVTGERQLPIQVTVSPATAAEFGRPGPAVKAVEILVNSRTVFREVLANAATSLVRRGQEAIPVPIDAGLNAISIVVEDEDGRRVRRGPSFAVFGQVAAPDAPRLRVLSIGVDEFDHDALPPIRFARRDADQVGAFLERPNDTDRYPQAHRQRLTFLGPEAETEAIEAALRSLVEPDPAEVTPRPLGAGDSVFVFVNSHFIDDGLAARSEGILPGDTRPRPVDAALFCKVLGELAGNGCKVVLLLDLHHDPSPSPFRRAALDDWVRNDLYKAGVIVFLASNAGPSHDLGPAGHGAFAQGILRLFQNPDAIPARFRHGDGHGVWTLDDFQNALRRNVAASSTDKSQTIGYYRPRSISPLTPIFDPPAPIANQVAQRGAE